MALYKEGVGAGAVPCMGLWNRGLVQGWSLYGEVQSIMDDNHMESPYEQNDR